MEKNEKKERKSEIERTGVNGEQKNQSEKRKNETKFTCSKELRIDRKIEQ